MKEDNVQRPRQMLKGIAAAVLIAGCFFLLKQRLPQSEDMMGMAALTAVCVIGSLAEKHGSGTETENFLGRQRVENTH